MEEVNDSTIKLGATTRVDSRGRESLPDDAFVDVGGDEKRDTGSQAVILLEELVEKDEINPTTTSCKTRRRQTPAPRSLG